MGFEDDDLAQLLPGAFADVGDVLDVVPMCGQGPFYPPGLTAAQLAEWPIAYARRLLERGPYSLARVLDEPFSGEGVYALFYHGGLAVYEAIRTEDSTCPVYVGQACYGTRLHDRLKQHYESIDQVDNLDVAEFAYRVIRLPDAFSQHLAATAEALLIGLFQPVWNKETGGLPGFGAKACYKDSRAQRTSVASPWDTLHEGRPGAGKRTRSRLCVEADLKPKCWASAYAYRRAMGLLKTPR